MSGFSYPPPIFLSSTYNPAFYLSLDPSGFLSYAYVQTLYVSRNDYRLSYITGITLGQGGANLALTLDGSRDVANINSLTASSITAGSMSGLTSLSVSGTLTATTVNATSDIQVNGTSYNLSLIDRVNVATIGTAQASKALVLDVNRSASNIYNLTIDPNGTGIVCSTLKFWNAAGTASNTLAHMYYVAVQEGGATASQAVVLNSTKDYSGIRNLSCSGTLTISTSIATPSITCDTITKAGTITLSPTTLNLNPTTLRIAGTAVTTTAAELNALDVTAGAAAVSKALVLDSTGSIQTITKMTCVDIISTKSECQITSGTALDTTAGYHSYPLCITDYIDTIVNAATGASSGNGMWFGTTTSDPLRLGVGNSTVMYLNSSSRLGVGLSSLGWSAEATIHAGYGGVSWDNTNGQRVRIGITNQDGTWDGYPNSVYGVPYTNGSDRRLKTDIRDCPHGLSTVMQMRPRLFRWKSSEDTEPDSIGFIAQEL
ncbi:hypothetical protein PR001_g24666 [Phytophthora rubi]|uniref:Peptidase S74 domain-containing protein n=1 Tax=Phytophthora rubi TaxID=129364 RepID=A0A6A3IG18_9STRA|nr:hypothetical protein PR001_g24666 [Phytophthora rubi]